MNTLCNKELQDEPMQLTSRSLRPKTAHGLKQTNNECRSAHGLEQTNNECRSAHGLEQTNNECRSAHGLEQTNNECRSKSAHRLKQ